MASPNAVKPFDLRVSTATIISSQIGANITRLPNPASTSVER
jgi:hypothetical protein